MHRHGHVESKDVIVEHADAEEEQDVDEPLTDGDSIGFDEERWMPDGEIFITTNRSDQQELNEGDQETLNHDISNVVSDVNEKKIVFFFDSFRFYVPDSGSDLNITH